ncbi:glycosyltransferase family 4 protein [Psychrobacter sp. DAB_AL43B]|uniref:glycosyltransferase family 4 protein n=1 Tax=Psychrobacter sp. DAB_AL43B TaxID=1028416 RepID=UPI0009A7D6E1|nr:glycosyltransferase family 4 protein [Psychrobacter sp. DAB_AL43B]SLJ83939.1 glycosyl transferase, group 1 [Psychrobacter sp. DAB_AL43B]
MKKICFLIGNLNNSGGTERVTTLIANELAKMNYNIFIISFKGDKEPFFELDDSIKIYSLYSDSISFKTNFFGVIWKLRSFIKNNKVDTLIVVDSISCIFSVPALYRLKINHICWEHFNFNINLGVRSRDLGRKLAARYCDYIITLTQRDKELWEQGLKNIQAKLVPIANPTPYENTNHIPSLEYKTVLAMGRLTYQKGFDLLIDAWAVVCKTNLDWTLRIVGSGEDEENLKQQAKNFSIEDRVNFVPATKNVETHYTTSSFYCLSSRFEGLPMVLLEAQAFGLPIVAFDCDTGPSELVNSKNGMLVEKENIQQLSTALIALMNNSKLQYLKKVNNTVSTNKNFTVKNQIGLWLDIL